MTEREFSDFGRYPRPSAWQMLLVWGSIVIFSLGFWAVVVIAIWQVTR